MDNKIKMQQLVVSQPLAAKLVALGLNKTAANHWLNDVDFEDETKKWMLLDADIEDYDENDWFPAWTYEELRVMIGHWFNGVELREPRPKPITPREEFEFLVAYPTSSRAYESGAEANGEWLAYLIQNNHIKPEEANERLRKRFNPTPDDF